jgi:hypothetical protein
VTIASDFVGCSLLLINVVVGGIAIGSNRCPGGTRFGVGRSKPMSQKGFNAIDEGIFTSLILFKIYFLNKFLS